MYIISIYVKNTETGNEDFSMIGRDFLPIGKQDYSATVFETKEEAIAYLKSASYEAAGAYGNGWEFQDMFKALKTIKKIKQLQKEMHAFSLAFLALQDMGLMPETERSKAKAQTMHDASHVLKDVLDGKSVDEAMKRLNSEVKIEEAEQDDDQN